MLVVTSLTSGGAERVATNLAYAWRTEGHEVTLLTIAAREHDFYELDSSVKRLALDSTSPSAGRLDAVWKNVSRMLKLRRSIVNENPDVVVVLMAKTNVITLLSTIGINTRILVAEHIFPGRYIDGKVWAILARYTYRLADSVVALNETCANWLRQHTFAKRVIAIPNTLVWPLPILPPVVEPPPHDPERFTFLSVGRLHSQKRFDRLIKCFATVKCQFPRSRLVIVGDGELKDELDALAKSVGLADSITLVGRVGNVGDWYRFCDAFVLSSDYEGFPGGLLEAMASGRAVVSVDCNTGPRDIIDHETNGLLCEVSEDSLAEAMLRIIKDEALRRTLESNGASVVNTYREELVMQMWRDEFAYLGLLPRC